MSNETDPTFPWVAIPEVLVQAEGDDRERLAALARSNEKFFSVLVISTWLSLALQSTHAAHHRAIAAGIPDGAALTTRERNAIARELATLASKLVRRLGWTDPTQASDTTADMAKAALQEVIRQNLGEGGSSGKMLERLEKSQKGWELFLNTDAPSEPPSAAKILVRLIHETGRARRKPKGARTSSGDTWVRADRFTSAASHAMNGKVVVDSNEYTHAPGVIRVVSSGFAVHPAVAKAARRAHQLTLPLGIEQDSELFELAHGDVNEVLDSTAGKVFAYLVLTSPTAGELQYTTLWEITQKVFQHKARIDKRRDSDRVAKALQKLDKLLFYYPGGGSDRLVVLSGIARKGEAPRPDMLVGYGLAAGLRKDNLEMRGLKLLKGWFPMNLTALLNTSTESALEMRLQIIGSAAINDAKNYKTNQYIEGLVPAYSLEEWLHRANAVSPGTYEYLQAKGKRRASKRRSLFEDKRKVDAAIESLKERGIFEVSGRKNIKLLPTEEHLEAMALLEHGNKPLD